MCPVTLGITTKIQDECSSSMRLCTEVIARYREFGQEAHALSELRLVNGSVAFKGGAIPLVVELARCKICWFLNKNSRNAS